MILVVPELSPSVYSLFLGAFGSIIIEIGTLIDSSFPVRGFTSHLSCSSLVPSLEDRGVRKLHTRLSWVVLEGVVSSQLTKLFN